MTAMSSPDSKLKMKSRACLLLPTLHLPHFVEKSWHFVEPDRQSVNFYATFPTIPRGSSYTEIISVGGVGGELRLSGSAAPPPLLSQTNYFMEMAPRGSWWKGEDSNLR